MPKYKVTFEFLNSQGKWITDDFTNNGIGFTQSEAENILNQLKYDEVCIKRNLQIEEM